VEFPDSAPEEANRIAGGLAAALVGAKLAGLLDAVPAARTLLLVFEPERLSRARLEPEVSRRIRSAAAPSGESRVYRIPVVYGGPGGPDLADLARGIGLTPGEFAALHAAAEYRVAFIGFSPGFPYLAGLPERLRAPRLPSPRPRVPAGSVAIGGPYAGIYPLASPGGWRLIGRTAARLFDAGADKPALLGPGDRVRFEPAAGALPTVAEPTPAKASRPVFRVLSSGVFSTIQGAPRYGLGSSGVAPGGAMDASSLAASNAVLGNDPGAPAIEVTLVGPELKALADCTVAVAGADFSVEYEGRPVAAGHPFGVAPGGRVRFGRARRGARAYLAAEGGLEDPRRPGDAAERLVAGDEVGLGPGPRRGGAGAREPAAFEASSLRAVPGPRAALFAPAEVERFFATSWRVAPASDRRGLRLEGPPLSPAREPEIPPEGMLPGSVEIPPGGHPIVLGPDGPVTGGYPAIATVIGADLALLGQAAPGSTLRFRRVSLEEALDARRRAGSTIRFP
jgi:KipI family sensor histidine kinase inhibitor